MEAGPTPIWPTFVTRPPRLTTRVLDTEETKRIFSNETFGRLIELVRPHLEADKRKLVYVFPASGRIGHLAQEPHALHCLYGAEFDELIMVVHDRRMMPVSEATFAAAAQYVRFVETMDHQLVQLGHYDGGRLGGGPVTIHLESPIHLLQEMQRRFDHDAPPHFRPPPGLDDTGAAWLDNLGIESETPIVTLHVRDAGHLANLAYHAFRGATLANYHEAIGRLLDRGYAVFRLGDAGSPRLEFDHPRLFDVPFRDDYADWMDVFLIDRSRFMLCCPSGPEALARIFGVPMLKVNALVENFVWNNDGDVLLFRHYRDEVTGRHLPYREILERGLSWFNEGAEFEEHGVNCIENTPGEIAAAVDEMLGRLDGTAELDPSIDARFREIGADFAARIHELKPDQVGGTETVVDVYALASPHVRCCQAFCAMHPYFLED